MASGISWTFPDFRSDAEQIQPSGRRVSDLEAQQQKPVSYMDKNAIEKYGEKSRQLYVVWIKQP